MTRQAVCPARPVVPMPPAALDLEFVRARPAMPGAFDALRLILVGCGGTGSWLAPAVARIARQFARQNGEVEVLFVDPDHVEEINTFRQNFCAAEVGHNKAETLARRFGAAWGLAIGAVAAPFAPDLSENVSSRTLAVLIGCVDNAAARQSLHAALQRWREHDDHTTWPGRLWWLDCGNAQVGGQVLLGSTLSPQRLGKAFSLSDRCSALPAPSLQHPELLIPRPEELDPTITGLSCEELAARNAQSLTINQMVAAVAADYLVGLVLAQNLKTYASYFDLQSKSLRSKYITPEALAPYALDEPPAKRTRPRARRRQPA